MIYFAFRKVDSCFGTVRIIESETVREIISEDIYPSAK